MAKRYAFFYFMRNEPGRIREIVPSHIEFWQTCRPSKYLGGPFADRTGGMITFEASGLAEATELAERDPFVMHDLIEQKWIKEWMPE